MEVDGVILSFLRGDQGSETRLKGTGLQGFHRMLQLWLGDETLPGRPTVRSVADLDQWNMAFGLLASAHPAAFIDALEARPHLPLERRSTIAAILGTIDDPRASSRLCELAADDDWIVRANAMNSLVRHDDAAARAAFERGLQDPKGVVRLHAMRGVSRSDPARATELYRRFLRRRRPTPLMRQSALAALHDLGRGLPVQDR